ncbi:MAG: hypothetical protein IRZ14_00015 [Chloroflexi bacterium]|nr:hypothetical protein [Chloroflexota bacterium]
MRRRLVADRFRRVWALVEYIVRHPGCHRRELARHFALSERQLQADLEMIRRELGLPLVRRQGYRFLEGDAPAPLGLPDLCLLGRLLQHAAAGRLASSEAISALAERLIATLPAHLRPLASAALAPAKGRPSDTARERALELLAQGAAGGRPIRLRYQPVVRGPVWEALIDLEAMLPYGEGLYLLGHCRLRRKAVMIDLDTVLHAWLDDEAPVTS